MAKSRQRTTFGSISAPAARVFLAVWSHRQPIVSPQAKAPLFRFVKNFHARGENLQSTVVRLGIPSAICLPMGKDSVLSESTTATLLDQLIAQQQELTAVAEFARAHDSGEIRTPRYRRLMPATAPNAGQQFAFEVDLDRCSGCKACVTACHALNGLDDGEAWRQVGMLISEDWRRPFRQMVPTTCHHCAEPACLTGCPVLAYEKDPVTGIVRHLDDQCIGCQYCIMMCPYEVPQYSKTRGIVRKCDMCSQRLAVGEAPACVQACPNEAIRITVVNRGDLETVYRSESTSTEQRIHKFLPTAPDPAITLPATRFISARALALDLTQNNAAEVRPQPPHTPLVWMLVLTQLGVGATSFALALPPEVRGKILLLSFFATALGLIASVAHLGKPAKAWRSFLGLRTSWLSREIVAFGGFVALLTIALVTAHAIATSLAAAVGLGSVLCSAFVYHATRREDWSGLGSFGKFFGSTLFLGAAAGFAATSNHWLAVITGVAGFVKIAIERRAQRGEDESTEERFPFLVRSRHLCAASAIALAFVSLLISPLGLLPALVLSFALAGELLERALFFRAVSPPRMPGS